MSSQSNVALLALIIKNSNSVAIVDADNFALYDKLDVVGLSRLLGCYGESRNQNKNKQSGDFC